jgi:hypothetical protein
MKKSEDKKGGSLNRYLETNKFPVGWVRFPAVGGFIFYRGWHLKGVSGEGAIKYGLLHSL